MTWLSGTVEDQFEPLSERSGGRFADWIETPSAPAALSALRAAEPPDRSPGRPLGSQAFLDRLAASTGRDPRPKRRGPKPKGIGVQ